MILTLDLELVEDFVAKDTQPSDPTTGRQEHALCILDIVAASHHDEAANSPDCPSPAIVCSGLCCWSPRANVFQGKNKSWPKHHSFYSLV